MTVQAKLRSVSKEDCETHQQGVYRKPRIPNCVGLSHGAIKIIFFNDLEIFCPFKLQICFSPLK